MCKVTIEDEMVTIPREEYEKLVEDTMILSALEACGVDNWDGYDLAMEMREQWKEEE